MESAVAPASPIGRSHDPTPLQMQDPFQSIRVYARPAELHINAKEREEVESEKNLYVTEAAIPFRVPLRIQLLRALLYALWTLSLADAHVLPGPNTPFFAFFIASTAGRLGKGRQIT